jgi:hypothetical protein
VFHTGVIHSSIVYTGVIHSGVFHTGVIHSSDGKRGPSGHR